MVYDCASHNDCIRFFQFQLLFWRISTLISYGVVLWYANWCNVHNWELMIGTLDSIPLNNYSFSDVITNLALIIAWCDIPLLLYLLIIFRWLIIRIHVLLNRYWHWGHRITQLHWLNKHGSDTVLFIFGYFEHPFPQF